MINPDKLALIQTIIDNCPSNSMRTIRGRKALAARISSAIGMYIGRVEAFVDEMDGLDLSVYEERQLFMDFLYRGL